MLSDLLSACNIGAPQSPESVNFGLEKTLACVPLFGAGTKQFF